MYLVFLYYKFISFSLINFYYNIPKNVFRFYTINLLKISFQQILFILEYFYKQIQNILLTKLYTTYKHKNILLTNKNYHI
jgi:hypothetical protein